MGNLICGPTTTIAHPTRQLPNTGADTWQMLAAAITLLAVGGLCVYITREQSL